MPSDYPLWFLLLSMFAFGAVFGSFLNVCIHRFPQHERLKDQLKALWGRSACPRCHSEIPARDNLPIIGWLLLRGKCRGCQSRISPRYPLIELGNGLLFALVYWFEFPRGLDTYFNEQCCYDPLGPQNVGTLFTAPVWMHLRFVFHLVLVEALVVATFIDLDLKIIPDGSTVPAMLFAVAASTALGQLFLVPVWFSDPHHGGQLTGLLLPAGWLGDSTSWQGVTFARDFPHLHGLAVSVGGLIVGGGIVWAVRIIGFRVLRQEAMGFGDVILMACIGSFIGWQPVIVVFFLAALCAMAAVMIGALFRRTREIAYGPYLSLGALILILGWRQIWPHAQTYFAIGIDIVPIGLVMGVSLAVCLMASQVIKRLLGIPLYREDVVEEWTSADQLHHYAGERVDPQQGQWPRESWPGVNSGRGLSYDQRWRNESTRR